MDPLKNALVSARDYRVLHPIMTKYAENTEWCYFILNLKTLKKVAHKKSNLAKQQKPIHIMVKSFYLNHL